MDRRGVDRRHRRRGRRARHRRRLLAAAAWAACPGPRSSPAPSAGILLPFTGQAISRRSFEAAVRLAKAEGERGHHAGVPGTGADEPCPLGNGRCRSSAPAGCRCSRAIEAARSPRLGSRSTRASAVGAPHATALAQGFSDQEHFDRIIVSGRRRSAVRSGLRRSQVAARSGWPRRDPHPAPGAGGHAARISANGSPPDRTLGAGRSLARAGARIHLIPGRGRSRRAARIDANTGKARRC